MNVIPIPETDENSNSEGGPNDVNHVSNNNNSILSNNTQQQVIISPISHSSTSPAVFSTIQQSQHVIGAV